MGCGQEVLAVCSLSGGKDSTACALLALDSGHATRFVFADTGNEHADTYEYVRTYLPRRLGITVEEVRADFAADIKRKRRYVVEKWPAKGAPTDAVERALRVLHPTGIPFLDLCIMKGRFPSRMAQFCTQELKRRPLDAYLLGLLEKGRIVESWRGIRRDESENRRLASPREQTAEGWWVVQPIVDWTAADVVSFVTSRGVELNPLYRQGMGRVGCMPCINANKAEIAEIARRFPEHVDRIREWERIVSEASRRGWCSFFTDCAEGDETPEATFRRLNIDARISWAKTSRGGRQFDLLKSGPAEPCSSIYGLCE